MGQYIEHLTISHGLITGGSVGYVPVFLFDGSEGEERMPVPGPIGPAGGTGPTGGTGPAGGPGGQGSPGVSVWIESDPGEDGATIPGAPGVSITGPQGIQGLPGVPVWLEADPGEDGLTIPGSSSASSGTVTHTVGALTSGQLLVGNGAADLKTGDLTGPVTTSGTTGTAISAGAIGTTQLAAGAATPAKTSFAGDGFILTAADALFTGSTTVGDLLCHPDRKGILSGATTANTLTQEFDGSDPLTWLAVGNTVNVPASQSCNGTVPNAYYWTDNTVAYKYGCLAFAPGPTFDFRAHLSAGSNLSVASQTEWGVAVTDTSLNNLILLLFVTGTGVQMYRYSSSAYTQVGSTVNVGPNAATYWRITLTGGTYQGWYSHDGLTYFSISTTAAVSFTAARAAIMSSGNTGGTAYFVSKWMRGHAVVINP